MTESFVLGFNPSASRGSPNSSSYSTENETNSPQPLAKRFQYIKRFQSVA